jgi:hypothetical protein
MHTNTCPKISDLRVSVSTQTSSRCWWSLLQALQPLQALQMLHALLRATPAAELASSHLQTVAAVAAVAEVAAAVLTRILVHPQLRKV